MQGKIHVILPGLFDLPLSELAPGLLTNELRNLNRILRLASPRPNQAFTIDAMLQRALAFPSASEQPSAGLPLAQAYATTGADQCGRLLLFRAIHLQPDLHSAIVVPIQQSQKNSNDITNIINELYDSFNVDCDITVIADGLFLMQLKDFDAPTHYPHILSVLGKAANPYIEQSRNSLRWYRLLNEMQMFLHQHPINQDRTRAGLLPVNSLWFWGGGCLPQVFDSNQAWYCDDPTLNRFAESLELATMVLDDVTGFDGSSNATVIDLRLIELLKAGVTTELDQLLLDVETRVLDPLLSAAARTRQSVMLHAGHEIDLELGPAAGLRFWRRPRNLMSWGGLSPDR